MTPDRMRQVEELYHSVRESAAGGMGEVFRAVDTRLGRAVAIKVVDQQFLARFEREARAISSLNHPHICTLYDIGPNYLVMELLDGETLSARLKGGPLPVEEALRYAAQIVSALADAHAHGIVHRDLKPGNIMLTKSGAKVLDFGLATWEGDDSLTGSRMIMGTPAYMAPEQREGKPSDARTDIYSFGRVLYEMLTGARATAERKPLPSKALETIVARCLEIDPARRWQSATELAGALEAERAGSAAGTKTHSKWILPAATAIFVIALIACYFVFRPARKLTEKDTIVLADFANATGDPVFHGTLRQGLAFQPEQSPFLKIMDDEQVHQELRLMSLPPGGRITNQNAHDICVRDGAAATIEGAIGSLGKNYVITLHAITCKDGATLAREQIQAQDKERVLNALGTAATAMRAKLGESRSSIQKLSLPLEQVTTSSLEALQSYTAGLSVLSQGQFLAAVPLFERATAQNMDAERLGLQNYPRDWGFHNGLAGLYIDQGKFEEGLKEGQEAVRLQPDVEPPYRRLLDAYICLDRLSDAKQIEEQLRAKQLGGARIHQRFLEIAYVEDDPAAANKEIQWYAGKPVEYLSFGLQAAHLNAAGQRRESSKLYQRAADTALRSGLRNAAAEFEEADARADALSGNCQTARRLGRPAVALAMCGDAARAEKLAAATSKIFPKGTIWNAVQLPEIRAAIELQHGQPAKAVELLASALPYERAYPDAVYLRGLAYLRLRKGVEAAAEFEKILDHKGASWGSTWLYPNWGLYYSIS